jgi:hypothetical protein
MKQGRRAATIYLSSPYEDLIDYRRVVYQALRRAGCDVIAMEDYVARDARVLEECLQDIANHAGIYVGIIGFRYGTVPDDAELRAYFGEANSGSWKNLSITEIEYRFARDVARIPCLTFVAREGTPWNPGYIDAYSNRSTVKAGEQVDRFRAELLSERLSSTFSTPLELATLVQAAIMRILGDSLGSSESGTPALTEWSTARDGSPFPGLQRFTKRLAPVYFGREADVCAVADLVSGNATRLVLVSGESGAGKSSLVDAGVLPTISRFGLKGYDNVRSVRVQPNQGINPCDALIRGLHQEVIEAGWTPAKAESELRTDPAILARIVGQSVSPAMLGAALIIFVDQFEELFTATREADSKCFADALTAVSSIESVRVIATVRSDLLHRCFEYEAFLETVRTGGHYPLGLVDLTSMIDMIRKPAVAAGLSISDRLVNRIVEDVGRGSGRLPILGFVLERLYLSRIGDVLSEQAYDQFGGADGAISDIVERASAELSKSYGDLSGYRTALEQVFSVLVTVDATGQPIRKRIARDAVPQSSELIVDHLTKARLLALEGTGPDSEVLLAHEKLFTSWPALKTWVAEHAENMRLLQYAEAQADEWITHHFDPVYLWHAERILALRLALRRVGNSSTSPRVERFAYPQAALLQRLGGNVSHDERLTIGIYLSRLGDSRPGVALRSDRLPDISWCAVPGGEVSLEAERGVLIVEPCEIARYPITWQQYKTFLNAEDGYSNELWWQGLTLRESEPGIQFRKLENHPAENVSWHDAIAFCRWFGYKFGYEVRLPTEGEWVQAATGGDPSFTWPWGPIWAPEHANLNESNLGRTTAVGMYPQGNAPCGAADMVGNIWEWCLNLHDRPQDCSLAAGGDRAIRGGSWYLSRFGPRLVVRGYRPQGRDFAIGFRLLKP